MVQFEAAERLVSSSAGDGDYRPVSVRVHFYSEPRFIRKVRKVGGGTSWAATLRAGLLSG
jgi:16S rRNA A1518/A1519 N6-dimethyltransferase RsmA/KsgA/DIM1 with predicted DNA glycosylase/AP lyase activity